MSSYATLNHIEYKTLAVIKGLVIGAFAGFIFLLSLTKTNDFLVKWSVCVSLELLNGYLIKTRSYEAHTDTVASHLTIAWTIYSAFVYKLDASFDTSAQVFSNVLLCAIVVLFSLRFWYMKFAASSDHTCKNAAHRAFISDWSFWIIPQPDGLVVQPLQDWHTGKAASNQKRTETEHESCYHHVCATIVSMFYEFMFWLFLLLCILPFDNNGIFTERPSLTFIKLLLCMILYLVTDIGVHVNDANARSTSQFYHVTLAYVLFVHPLVLFLVPIHIGIMTINMVRSCPASVPKLKASRAHPIAKAARAPRSTEHVLGVSLDEPDYFS